jgi:hypothetical protein
VHGGADALDSEPPLARTEPAKPSGEPSRHRFALEQEIGSLFFAAGKTAQRAGAGQWLDGCKIVQDALDMGMYKKASEAVTAFAKAVYEAVDNGSKLGFALQQTQLSAPDACTAQDESMRVRPRAPGPSAEESRAVANAALAALKAAQTSETAPLAPANARNGHG